MLIQEDYVILKNILTVNSNVNDEYKTKLLRERYKKIINSKRKCSAINSITELINVLEKRDAVSYTDITLLKEIASEINDTIFFQYLHSKQNESINNSNNSASTNSNNNENSENSVQSVEERVHQTIINSVGKKWPEFARCLNVPENEIDEIKINYPDNSKNCVKKVLQFYKTNTHPRNYKRDIFHALTSIRRNDIRQIIENIYTDNNML